MSYQSMQDGYFIAGELKAEDMPAIQGSFKGLLYLATDGETDKGAPNGFASVLDIFNAATAKHIGFNPSKPIYQASCADYPYQVVQAYKAYEEALDSIPQPTLVSCKSGRRASAVYASYKAVKNNMTVEDIMADSKSKGLTFVGAPGMVAWVTCVINNLRGTSKPIIFRQMFEKGSSTYTYLLADSITKTAVLVDPVLETVERDLTLVKALKLNLKYCINTHIHVDHITGSGMIKSKHPEVQSVLSIRSNGKADVKVNEYESIVFGERKLYLLPTPGHTEGCSSLVLDNLSMVFTGDALLIRGCGRTDFQGGSASTLYKSVHSQILQSLPKSCLVYPAHDYNGMTCSSVAEELEWNPRLTKSEEEFIQIMDLLNLPKPAKIDEAVPANMNCGVF